MFGKTRKAGLLACKFANVFYPPLKNAQLNARMKNSPQSIVKRFSLLSASIQRIRCNLNNHPNTSDAKE